MADEESTSSRLKMPPERDFGFYQRRKHDKWTEVPAPSPTLEGPVADSHAHVHSLPDPAWELVRCAANGVRFVCEICDPSEDALDIPNDVRRWQDQAREIAAAIEFSQAGAVARRQTRDAAGAVDCAQAGVPNCHSERSEESLRSGLPGLQSRESPSPSAQDDESAAFRATSERGESEGEAAKLHQPAMRITAGVHPHNAKLYDEAVEQRLLTWLSAPETVVLGEIGLDYHYDFSPREEQRRVFRRQLQLAKELDLPVSLHLRGGEDPVADNAHREAYEILSEVGFPACGTILHCCTLPPDELKPWIEADCYVAYGGALTFASSDDARAGACLVPEDRLLLETDSPYMTPVPMRGIPCTPAHVVFTAARLAELRGYAPGEARKRFLQQLWDNTQRFFGF